MTVSARALLYESATVVDDEAHVGDARAVGKYWTASAGWSDGYYVVSSANAPQMASGSDPAVVSRSSSSIDVFVRGSDNRIWTTFWANGTWNSGWWTLTANPISTLTSPSVVARSTSNLDVFTHGWDDHAWTTFYTASGGWATGFYVPATDALKPAATYTYAPDGLRESKTVNGTTTRYVYDAAGTLLLDGATAIVYGPAGPIEQITATTTLWYHTDRQGSTRILSDSTGAKAASYTYSPWGQVTSQSGAAASLYLRHRYYDPTTAQFLTRDPLVAQTRSVYSYTNNSPLNATDPSGMFALGLCLVGALGFLTVVGGAGCVVTDGTRIATTTSGSGGAGLPTASGGVGILMSNTRDVRQLPGQSACGGASVGEVIVGGVDICKSKNIWTATPWIGAGVEGNPLVFEVHGTRSITGVHVVCDDVDRGDGSGRYPPTDKQGNPIHPENMDENGLPLPPK